MLVRVTFSQNRTGSWTTSDIAWVASLQGPGELHRWCPLTTGITCADPALDAAVLARATDIVNRYGADTAGAHRLDHH